MLRPGISFINPAFEILVGRAGPARRCPTFMRSLLATCPGSPYSRGISGRGVSGAHQDRKLKKDLENVRKNAFRKQ